MAESDSSRDIDQAAADWVARRDRGLLNASDEARLQDWLRQDPRRRGALLRAEALSMLSLSGQALGRGFDAKAFGAADPQGLGGLSRRGALALGGAGGAALVLGLALAAPAGAVSRTRRGEMRLVPLKDGSTVLLNTQSRVRVHYDGMLRGITLLEGEAYVSVTRDPRPFILQSGDCRLRASQASFRVRRLAREPLDVLVSQGSVEVLALSHPGAPLDCILPANSRLILAGAQKPEAAPPGLVTRELAWREGKLAFEGETLQRAADAFARYSDARIEIRDPDLAREPVAGLFAANDPAGFSRAIARVFDADVAIGDRRIVISRTRPAAL